MELLIYNKMAFYQQNLPILRIHQNYPCAAYKYDSPYRNGHLRCSHITYTIWPISVFFNGMISWSFSVNLVIDECHITPLMISQHWFRWWLGAVRQRAITWANFDLDLCCHMASLGHDKWTRYAAVCVSVIKSHRTLWLWLLIHALDIRHCDSMVHHA